MLRFAIEVIGWLAAALMLSAYLLLTLGKVGGDSKSYQWLNVLSAAGLIVNCAWNGAYPSAFIDVVWMLIGLYGVFGRPVAGSPAMR